VVLVAPLFGIVAAACSNGRMGTHTTMVTGHILTLTQIAGNLVMARRGSPSNAWGKAELLAGRRVRVQ
jgi:hypothetical protein